MYSCFTMMRCVLFFCLIIFWLDVPKIDAAPNFVPLEKSKQNVNDSQSNVRGSQSNTSTSDPNTSGLRRRRGRSQPNTSALRLGTNDPQPSVGHSRPSTNASRSVTSGLLRNTSGSGFQSSVLPLFLGLPLPQITSTSQSSRSSLQPGARILEPPNIFVPVGTQRILEKNALKRLQKELQEITEEPSENCHAELESEDNLFKWVGTIKGPVGTPYEGGVFKLLLIMPFDYPSKPPNVKFLTKIYHCNISLINGSICLDILKNRWSPSMKISSVLLSIYSLLTDPNPNDPLEPVVANLYKNHRELHDEIARDCTQKYAKE